MKKLIVTICMLLMAFSESYGQQLFLIVYSGNVSEGQQQLQNRIIHNITPGAKFKFDSKSASVVYSKTNAVDINPKTDQNLTAADLAAKLNKAMMTAANATGFFNYIGRYHEFYEDSKKKQGEVVAGIRRLNEIVELKADGIFPADSATVIGENVRLQWDPAAAAADDELIVTMAKSDELVIRQAAPAKGSTFIKADKEGTYNWKIYASMEDKATIDRIFIRPNAATAKKLQDNLSAFKLQIAAMGEDTKKLLLEEYLIANNIAVN